MIPSGISTPDLSIIIPTYNRLPLLKEALDSFVGKLSCSYEAIIVDDGSADGTCDYLRMLGEPFRVFFTEHQGGPAARNTGLEAVRGRYVKFLDDDDLLNAEVVDAQVGYLDMHANIDVCYSDAEIWWIRPDTEERREIWSCSPLDDPVTTLLAGWACPSFAFAYRAEIAHAVRFAPELWNHQDIDYLLQVAICGARFAHMDGIAGCYRKHSLDTVSEIQGRRRAQSRLQMYRRAHRALEARQALTSQFRCLLAHRYFECAAGLLHKDRRLFQEIMQEIRSLEPDFTPAGPKLRFASRLVGCEGALRLRHLVYLLRGINQ